MHILFVLENYLPHIGGVELVFKNTCERLVERGHRVTVITHHIPGTKLHEIINGVRIIRVRCMDNRYLFTFAAIPSALREAASADIIHTTTFNGAPPAWLAARIRGKPVILAVMETWIGKWREYTDFSAPKAALHELLERAVFMPKFDLYASISHSTTRQLAAVLPARMKERIITIYNGFDDAHWRKPVPRRTTDAMRKRFGINGKFVIFGYGRPGTSKGFPYLLDAMPRIRKRIPNAILFLILSTDRQYAKEIDRMKARAKELGVADSVIFHPPQKYNDLTLYAHMADCIVVPSITEGFGYTTLESCATGTPVVASDTTSIPEVIHSKHLLVKPKNPRAIAEGVIEAYYKRYKIAKKKVFRWDDTLDAIEGLYARVLREKGEEKKERIKRQ